MSGQRRSAHARRLALQRMRVQHACAACSACMMRLHAAHVARPPLQAPTRALARALAMAACIAACAALALRPSRSRRAISCTAASPGTPRIPGSTRPALGCGVWQGWQGAGGSRQRANSAQRGACVMLPAHPLAARAAPPLQSGPPTLTSWRRSSTRPSRQVGSLRLAAHPCSVAHAASMPAAPRQRRARRAAHTTRARGGGAGCSAWQRLCGRQGRETRVPALLGLLEGAAGLGPRREGAGRSGHASWRHEKGWGRL